MLLQLTGRLDPGETYAIVSLEGADLVAHSAPPSLDYVEFELVNIVICQRPDHNHFEAFPPTAEYPLPEGVWNEKITIKVPRPLPLVHRRRTRYFTFPEDPVPSVKRFKRAPPTTAKIVPLTDYQVEYRARFSNPVVVTEIVNIQNATLTRIINHLQGVFRGRIEKHFQRLLLDLPAYEFDTTESSRRNLYKVKITLPPMTRQTCSHKEIWTLMGLENYIVEVGGAGDKKWGLVNASKTENRTFLSDYEVETMTILGAVSMVKRINLSSVETIYFYFERYPASHPTTYLNFEEEALCLQNPTATAYFFQLLVDCIIQLSSLPTHSLRITQSVENTKTLLKLSKAATIESTGDTPNNFTIYGRFGSEIMEKLGLKSPTVILNINGNLELNKNDEETEEETTSCQLAMDKLMREQFYNQTGGVTDITAAWRKQWKTILQQRHVEIERKKQADKELERQRLQKQQEAAAAATAALERQRLQKEAELDRQRQEAAAELERQRLQTEAELERQRLQKEKDDAAAAAAAATELERQRQQQLQPPPPPPPPPDEKTEQVEGGADVAEHQPEERVEGEAGAEQLPEETERVEGEGDAAKHQPEEQIEAKDEEERVEGEGGAREEERVEGEVVAEHQPEEQVEGEVVAEHQPEERIEGEGDAVEHQPEEQVEGEVVAEHQPEERIEGEGVAENQPEEQVEEAEVAEQQPDEEEAGGGGGGGAEEEENASDGDDAEEEEENPWMEIEIDNPEPRPMSTFLVANSIRPHICTPPNTFPDYCTLLVKEGEPVDYISKRGACSILGIIRNRQPNIYTNKCIVRNIKNMKHIAIEFVDEAFNTFKIAADSPFSMWIKLDLRSIKNVYY